MTMNLLLWKWSEEFDTQARRKARKLKFSDVTAGFLTFGDHPAIGQGEVAAFCNAIDSVFGSDEETRPFIIERYEKCAVINYPNEMRFDLVPKVAAIGKKFGLNASEF